MIGKLVAEEPGVEYTPLFYKPLGKKIREQKLKKHQGKFDSFMNTPVTAYPILKCWINKLPHCSKKISHGPSDLTLYSDASGSGWGEYNETVGICTRGEWSIKE